MSFNTAQFIAQGYYKISNPFFVLFQIPKMPDFNCIDKLNDIHFQNMKP